MKRQIQSKAAGARSAVYLFQFRFRLGKEVLGSPQVRIILESPGSGSEQEGCCRRDARPAQPSGVAPLPLRFLPGNPPNEGEGLIDFGGRERLDFIAEIRGPGSGAALPPRVPAGSQSILSDGARPSTGLPGPCFPRRSVRWLPPSDKYRASAAIPKLAFSLKRRLRNADRRGRAEALRQPADYLLNPRLRQVDPPALCDLVERKVMEEVELEDEPVPVRGFALKAVRLRSLRSLISRASSPRSAEEGSIRRRAPGGWMPSG